jgi:histidine triad (HIT) family protein
VAARLRHQHVTLSRPRARYPHRMDQPASVLHDPACALCRSIIAPDRAPPLWRDDLFEVRHIDPPWGVAGWMMLVAHRHVAGPAHFNDAEARAFGPLLRQLSRTLQQVTGALRIYTAALGEAVPHLHCHLVPRREEMPLGAKGWAVFDLQRAAGAGEVVVGAAEVERICAEYRNALMKDPPPGR